MTTPFNEMEAAIEKLVASMPKELAQAAAEIEDLKCQNQALLSRVRKLEEENHDMRVT